MQDAFERPISGRPVQEIERAAGTDPAFFQDTVIPAGAAGFLNAPGHADCLEALVQPPAGLPGLGDLDPRRAKRSEEHTSELQSLMRISYAVFCLKKKTHTDTR